MKTIFTCIAIAFCLLGSAQNDTAAHHRTNLLDTLKKSVTEPEKPAQTHKPAPIDSTQAAFLRDSIRIATPKLVRLEMRLDSRVSSFQGTGVNIYGYYIGSMIKSKLSLGVGYYRIATVLPAKKVINGINTGTSLVVNCGSLNSELIYYNRRYISLGFPLEFAVGQYDLKHTNTDNSDQLIDEQVKFLAFANFGLSGTFKPFKFIGLKLMVGYRKSIYPEERVFEFNGVYTSLGLFIDFADLKSNFKMYRLLKRYNKVTSPLSTKVDLFTD